MTDLEKIDLKNKFLKELNLPVVNISSSELLNIVDIKEIERVIVLLKEIALKHQDFNTACEFRDAERKIINIRTKKE